MVNFFVPIIPNEKEKNVAELFSVESRLHNITLFNYHLIENQIEDALNEKFNILIYKSIEEKKVFFNDFGPLTKSIFLGVLLSAYATKNNRSFKKKYNSITVTGNFEIDKNQKIKLSEVSHVKEKFGAVRNYATKHKDAKHLFIYVSTEEEIEEGWEGNIFVLRFSKDSSFEDICAEIFESTYINQENPFLSSIYNETKNLFVQTRFYINLKKIFLKPDYNGIILYGASNTGKSIMAKSLCLYLIETHAFDDVVWIFVNDNQKLWDVLKDKKSGLNSDSNIKTLYKDNFNKLDDELSKYRNIILVIDNLEYNFIDDLIDFFMTNYSSYLSQLKFIFTSLINYIPNQKSSNFRLISVNTSDLKLSYSELDAIINSTMEDLNVRSIFSNNNEESKTQFQLLLKEICKDVPGFIPNIILNLRKMNLDELITLLRSHVNSPVKAREKIINIALEQISFLSRLVLFTIIETVLDFDYETIKQLIIKKVFNSESIKKSNFISNLDITNSLEELLDSFLLYRVSDSEITIKKDILFYCLDLNKSKKDILREIVDAKQTIISDLHKALYAIRYNSFDKFRSYAIEEKNRELGGEYYAPLMSLYLRKSCEYDCDLEFLTFLIKHGADVNEKDDDGNSPLDCLVEHTKSNYKEKIMFLLKSGAKLDDRILLTASCNTNSDVLSFLIKEKLYKNINYSDEVGTALCYTAWFSNLENMKILVDAGADYTKKSLLCATMKSSHNNAKTLDFIYENGYFNDINEIDANSEVYETPLYIGLVLRTFDKCKFLLSKGANWKIKVMEGRSLLIWAARRRDNIEALNFILENRLYDDINERDNYDMTAFLNAVSVGGVLSCSRMISAGADWKLRDFANSSALIISAQNNDSNVLAYILQNKLYDDINEQDNLKKTALLTAAEYGTSKNCELLLNHGANPFIKDFNQNTIFHLSINNSNNKTLKVLLKNVKDAKSILKDKNNDGYTALELARNMKNKKGAELLEYYELN